MVSKASPVSKILQVVVDVLCIHTNFGVCGFFSFGDIATFKFGQIWPNFPLDYGL